MADVKIYHPETGGTVDVPEESLHHHRQSGWVLRSEWEENQRQAPPEKTPTRPAKKE